MTPGKVEQLCMFLVRVFSVEDLSRWIAFNYKDITPSMPSGASLTALAFTFVETAEKRGLVDATLFDGLERERPQLRAELVALRRAWDRDRWVDDPSHTAIVLDRVLQWREILTTCGEDPRHLVILVHGDRDQDLDLFVTRIKRYLDHQCPRRHAVHLVHRTRDRSTAVTAGDWARHLCVSAGFRTSDLAVALTRATQTSAALFVLEDARKPLHGLGGEDFEGLAEFLCDTLPQTLATVRCVHPIRVVVSVEHSDPPKPVRRALDDLGKRLRGFKHLAVVRPKELDFPPLKDVREHVLAHFPDLDPARWAQCEALHTRVKKQFRRTLRDLADPLDELISEWEQERNVRIKEPA